MTAEEIAAKLSPAQKQMMLAAQKTISGGLSFPYRGNLWRALPGLHKKGLATSSMVPSWATAIGMQVRSILEGTSHAD